MPTAVLDEESTISNGIADITSIHPIYFPVPFDWSSEKAGLQPPGVPDAAWNIIFSNFLARVGSSVLSVRTLDQDATYLSRLGEHVDDLSQLLAFELQRAGDYGAIAQRWTLGSLGYGRTTIADTRPTVDGSGNVTISNGGPGEPFFIQPDGSYQALPVDTSTLTLKNGVYQLRTKNGQVTTFNADGTIHSVSDPDGTGFTSGYTNGQLTTLTDTQGNVTTLQYNTQGRIASVTDPEGRVTTYGYDAATGTLLTSVTTPAGTTSFSYVMSGAAANAVAQVTYPDGTNDYFDYDAQGRLVGTHRDGGQQPVTYTYDDSQPGAVAVTQADGSTITYLLNDLGLAAETVDAAGNVSQVTFDAVSNPIRVAGPGPVVTGLTYDALGNVTGIVDPLGNRTTFSYAPALNRLASIRDANGNITRYATNAQGQLTTTTYDDGSQEKYTYDAAGNVSTSTDRNGQTTQLSYDPTGTTLTREVLADNSQATFTYDAHHNLTSATNANGTTTYTYDAADRLTGVSYPNGLSLHYSYDAAGRRSQMMDQNGYTVNYAYDFLGRLFRLTDGSGNPIVTYSYDAVGRLARKDLGNGTYTTYAYDSRGNVSEVANFAPDGSTVSKFDYTYDAQGNPLTITSAQGTTTYAYDAAGQLVSVILPGGRTVTYAYDAAGNRTTVTDSGTPTSYTTNNLNEYTAAGATTYRYDAAGNLIAQTDASGTTSYAYDQNGRLTQVVSPTAGVTIYLYDAVGNRIATIHNGQRTNDLIDSTGIGSVVAQYDGSGNLIDHYVYGLDLTSQVTAAGGANYYNFDASGNTSDLTGPSGAVLDQYTYLPFGETLTATGPMANPFTFVGQYGAISQGDGLVSMRNRWYDPATGRFTQPDPLGLNGGDTNLYRYVANGPTGRVDPSGLNPIPIIVTGSYPI